MQHSGFIAIMGRPNVGKSTLMNAMVGEKVAIVSNKPQTTRNRICAILNRGESQFVFLDTPGLHKARTRLGDYMVNVVKESVADVDAVMLLVEPIPNVGGPEAELIARIKTLGCPSVLVINKVDTLEHKEELLEVIHLAFGLAHLHLRVRRLGLQTFGDGVAQALRRAARGAEPPDVGKEDVARLVHLDAVDRGHLLPDAGEEPGVDILPDGDGHGIAGADRVGRDDTCGHEVGPEAQGLAAVHRRGHRGRHVDDAQSVFGEIARG